MSADFLKLMTDAHSRRNASFIPKLQKPALNAICDTEEEYDAAIKDKHWRARQPETYLPSRRTFFEQQATPSAHMDREPLACARFYIFRFGSMTLRHQWEGINLVFRKEHFRGEKTRAAGVERRASLACRKTIYDFVCRCVGRTGGLALWRTQSRFQDRYDCFEACYDELPEFCDTLTYSEEVKSVNIGNMHAVEMMESKIDTSDMRHAFKKFTKLRFMRNCEAAYQFLLNGPHGQPNLWATRNQWKCTARDPEVLAIEGLTFDVQDVPGQPFGQEGQYGRKPPIDAPGPQRYARE